MYQGIVDTGAVETRPRRRSGCSVRCTAAPRARAGACCRVWPRRSPGPRAGRAGSAGGERGRSSPRVWAGARPARLRLG
ncbi:hypothetical protein NKG05_25550 [Oerskovia sp. M15]